MFATVGFLHLTDVPVEVGVGPAHELGPLGLTVLVTEPAIFIFVSSVLSSLLVPSLVMVPCLGKQMTTSL